MADSISEHIDKLESSKIISPADAGRAKNWASRFENLKTPVVHVTQKGEVQFVWSLSKILLEVDVLESGVAYWFARDRSSGAYEDGFSSTNISDELRKWLGRTND